MTHSDRIQYSFLHIKAHKTDPEHTLPAGGPVSDGGWGIAGILLTTR